MDSNVSVYGYVSNLFGSFHLFLLPLKDFVIILVFLKFLLAAVEQQLAEVHSDSWLVSGGHFELKKIIRKGARKGDACQLLKQ